MPSTSAIKKQLDVLIKQIVKIRDKFTCQKCFKVVEGSNCHASHVIPVSAGNKLRWDEKNLKVLCYHHHINWWHKNPTESGEWFKKSFPDRWKYLEANKGMIQMKEADFLELRKTLKSRLKSAGI